MTASEIIQTLNRSSGVLLPNGNDLTVDAPDRILTPALIEQIRQHKAELLAALNSTQTCEKCGAVIETESGERWRHTWCPNGCRWTWTATDGGSLADSGAPGFGEARKRMAELLALNQCPNGCGKMILQDRARDVWYCPGCRLWVVAGVVQ